MSDFLLGMDLGTTNIKAAIFDTDGNALFSASASYPLLLRSPNAAEQKPDDWWKTTKVVLREITEKAGLSVVRAIRAISVSSHFPTLLPLDKKGNVLREAVIWADKRAYKELDKILDVIGRDAYVASAVAQPDAVFLPCKLLWFKENEPHLFEKTYRFLQVNGYINYMLTGEMTFDQDTASLCQCLDIRTGCWSEVISRAVGFDLNELLPQPLPADTVIGTVTNEAALETGLVPGTPVAAGTSDTAASMYAAGLCHVGEAAECAGTTSLVYVGHDQPSNADIPVPARPCPVNGMPYLFSVPISSTGASINWYLQTFGAAEHAQAKARQINVFDLLNEMAFNAPAGSNGLLFFPYMVGERAPLWNSHAKGMFIGLSLDTERRHIIRSIFEGTAFALRHVIENTIKAGASVKCLRITGGGAKSRVWSQIKASVLGVPVYLPDEKTGGVIFGDALIAGQSVGIFHDTAESIERMVSIKEIIEPDMSQKQIYDELFPYYLSMYRHLDSDLRDFKKSMEFISQIGEP